MCSTVLEREDLLLAENIRSLWQMGYHQGSRPDLVGGGFLRSTGGWIALKECQRRGDYIKGDERILGSSDFVTQVLKKADEALKQDNCAKKGGD